MLSYAAWQRELGGDPRVIGRTLRLNSRPWQVVGVLPRGFVGPMGEADLYLPLDLGATLRDPTRARRRHWLGVVGRLAPEATVEGAQRDLVAIAAQMARQYPDSDAGFSASVVSLRESMAGDTRTPLILLMASAGLVLLITCANLAAALLSRTLSRRQEFAVRVALGARRGRLVRQLLTESVLLAVAGGLVGILLASLGLAVLRRLELPALPAYAVLSLDRGAVLVTFLLALATGAVFGLAPALSAGRTSPQGTLREGTRAMSESRRTRRLRGALVAGQIALCVSLLAGAGLMARSLWAMATAPIGFNPDGVLAVDVQLTSHKYDKDEALIHLYDELNQRLRSLPGVVSVAQVSELPGVSMDRNGLAIQGVTWPAGAGQPFIRYVDVSDDYFRTLGIPLLRGRTFGPVDRPGAPKAIVISEGMAKKYWPGGPGQAVGARLRLGPDLESPWSVVVGVVGDVRNDPALPEAEPMSYASVRQEPWGNNFLLRTKGDPLALVSAFRRELAAIDPEIPIRKADTLRAYLAAGMAGRRLPVLLMTAFGALALLLASVGVYALFTSMVAARERELGLRIVLGSTRQAVAGLVLRGGAAWMAAGLAAGAAGVVVVARLLRNLLFGVPPFDPVALGASLLMLLACATTALLVPVRRATRVDPITVIRE
jgi:predicted permease